MRGPLGSSPAHFLLLVAERAKWGGARTGTPACRVRVLQVQRYNESRFTQKSASFTWSTGFPTSLRPKSSPTFKLAIVEARQMLFGQLGKTQSCLKVVVSPLSSVQSHPLGGNVAALAMRETVSAGVAQLVEHLFCKQKVRGSSPLPSSDPVTSSRALPHIS